MSKVYADATSNVEYPVKLNSEYVRAAHLYNYAFTNIRENFVIAGLLSHIQVTVKLSPTNNYTFGITGFDYFRTSINLMEFFFKN